MKIRCGALDTLSGWIAFNIVIAIAICIVLNAAFVNLAGIWARPDFPGGGLGERAAAIVHTIGRMPKAQRRQLAAAASTSRVAVAWYTDEAHVPLPISRQHTMDGTQTIRKLLDRPRARAAGFTPRDLGKTGEPLSAYHLAVDLPDGSWVVLTATKRLWGVDKSTRYFIIGLFVLASTLVVAVLASRRLARPMKQAADTAHRFSTDIQAHPMPAHGPREFRVVIEAFNHMQERIQRFVTDRNDMLTAISHDLRAPLTRLRLRGEFIEDADQKSRLFRDVDEMQHMIDAALSFFRNETDPEPHTRFDLSELIHLVIEDTASSTNVVFDGPPHQIAEGRPNAIRRALTNVIDNAVKYGRGGRVTLHETEHELRLYVDDPGPGIPHHQQAAVFRPFFRLENSRNRRTGGVGLGLGAARSIVRAHGGDLVLNNLSTQGLRVTITLPHNV
ncbi:ATP-binding protein [Salinisphaera sp. Q1T1-3]|uniref:ATP-binding protein n=1 Tax=Salinisphaera sp. Q1T1-3 TaxID=2321229 RepID=UPI000E73BDB2|nr:ATP-binding protein [Salinisphaera sp. Q1T1-3]RJS93564.1 HAMP domain-containing protein [Salinisphaera sp. Q1T1-3]